MECSADILIAEVKKRSLLYDNKHKQYFDVNAKCRMWKEIAEILMLSSDECRKRWKHLRETFVKKYKSSGSEHQSWRYFESMTFLTEYIQPRKRHSDGTTIVFKEEDSLVLDSLYSPKVFKEEDTFTAEPMYSDFSSSFSSCGNVNNDSTLKAPLKKTRTIETTLSVIEETANRIRDKVKAKESTKGNSLNDLIGQTISALLNEIPSTNRDAARAELFQCVFKLKQKYGDID